MNRRNDCNCQNTDRSTEQEIQALGRQLRYLSRLFVDYMNQDQSNEQMRQRSRELAADLERIIGGRPVDPGAFEECCLIGNSSGGGFMNSWFCTGTLIHPRVVVSADHCIGRSSGNLDPNSIAIGVDDENQVGTNEIIRVARIHKHPTEDVALLVLQSPAEVTPIDRASIEEVGEAERVELVGFGNTDPTGTVGFGTKRQVNVPMHVVRQSDSQDLSDAEATLGFNSHTEFVAGRKGSGKDSCNGDSGGPAYIFIDGVRKLAGATSRATDEANDACGDGGVYVRIDKLQDWIDQVIGQL